MLRSLNGNVATVPFSKHGLQAKVATSGLVLAENYTKLTPLRVVADGPDGIKTGDIAYVEGKFNNQPWAKAELEKPDGSKFILVPLIHVAMVERPESAC
jgi:hypothetical protein